MNSLPHHCTYTHYEACGHNIMNSGHLCSVSLRTHPEYRGGRTAHAQEATCSMTIGTVCPNCRRRAQLKLEQRLGVAVG